MQIVTAQISKIQHKMLGKAENNPTILILKSAKFTKSIQDSKN
jgi:hypothetical protein